MKVQMIRADQAAKFMSKRPEATMALLGKSAPKIELSISEVLPADIPSVLEEMPGICPILLDCAGCYQRFGCREIDRERFVDAIREIDGFSAMYALRPGAQMGWIGMNGKAERVLEAHEAELREHFVAGLWFTLRDDGIHERLPLDAFEEVVD